MTDIAPVSPTAPGANVAANATEQLSPETLDYDAFLRLLVAQMENQDPLEPQSDTEYIAQLATFSNVEQNILTNERLEQLLSVGAATDAASLIGRTLSGPDGTSGEVASVRITSSGAFAELADGRTLAIGDGLTIT